MITRISGKLVSVEGDQAILAIDAFEYQVLIPDFVRGRLQTELGTQVSLHTIQYIEGNPTQGRLTPRLVGFLSEVELAFFEAFCSVDGVGVRKALRAMVRPVKDVAVMITEQDAKGLSTLPGVGAATAERIIAKLRRKMSRFALMVSDAEPMLAEVESDVVHETNAALIALGHNEAEARRLIEAALQTKRKYKDVEALLHAIYEKQK